MKHLICTHGSLLCKCTADPEPWDKAILEGVVVPSEVIPIRTTLHALMGRRSSDCLQPHKYELTPVYLELRWPVGQPRLLKVDVKSSENLVEARLAAAAMFDKPEWLRVGNVHGAYRQIFWGDCFKELNRPINEEPPSDDFLKACNKRNNYQTLISHLGAPHMFMAYQGLHVKMVAKYSVNSTTLLPSYMGTDFYVNVGDGHTFPNAARFALELNRGMRIIRTKGRN